MINDRYIIEKKIGEGRSQVYLATDSLFNGKVVLKILPSSAADSEKKSFAGEFGILNALDHPGIIKVLEYGSILKFGSGVTDLFPLGLNDRFIAEEYFDGIPLSEIIDGLSRDIKLSVIKEIVLVLFYMHQSNFVYLDLKPENILCSRDSNYIRVKLIDFGLSRHASGIRAGEVFGSTRFIAPEILNREHFNFKADLYSLGVLMYLMFYDRYPFNSDDPLEIYKSQLEGNFVFPENHEGNDLSNVIRKLMSRNPEDRYENVLMVLRDIGAGLPEDFIEHWSFPSTFSGRSAELKTVEEFLSGKAGADVLIVRGEKGSGRTALLRKLRETKENAVVINAGNFNFRDSLNNNILRSLFYNPYVHTHLTEEISTEVDAILDSGHDCGIEKMRALLAGISDRAKMIILIDDFDEAGEFYEEYFSQILPIFLINGSKLILTAAAGRSIAFAGRNTKELNLAPFGKAQVDEYVENNFASFFPGEKISELIISYSRLNPGDVAEFIGELARSSLINFTARGIEMPKSAEQNRILERLKKNYFVSRLKSLTAMQLRLLEAAAFMNINTDADMLSQIVDAAAEETNKNLDILAAKNIFLMDRSTNRFSFVSSVLKKHLKDSVEDKKSLRVKIAEVLQKKGKVEYLSEIALQYEDAGKYEESFTAYRKVVDSAYSANALRYITTVLKKLISFPVNASKIAGVRLELSRVLLRLGNFNEALTLTDELLHENALPGEQENLLLQQSELLLKTGNYEKAVSVLSGIAADSGNSAADILLADAYLYMEEYDKALTRAQICAENPDASDQLKGKANNLLALHNLYSGGELDACINYFRKAADYFKRANDNIMYAGMTLNIGNIHVMKNDYDSAMRVWNETSELNKSHGNLDQEAKLLMNYGILLLDLHEYEKALENYRKAKSIFEHYGDIGGTGTSCINLAEINFILCSYPKALENLKEARTIFNELGSSDDLTEILYLYGRIYFALWNKDLLINTAGEMEKLINDPGHPAGNKKLFVEALACMIRGRYKECYDLAEKIKSEAAGSDERENKNIYAESIFLQADAFALLGKRESVPVLLNDEKLTALCASDKLLRAKREYLLAESKLALGHPDALQHMTECFSLIENLSITEISWKAMFLFVRFYKERGNEKKAETYLLYLKNILSKIFSDLKNSGLEESYSNNPRIREILNSL